MSRQTKFCIVNKDSFTTNYKSFTNIQICKFVYDLYIRRAMKYLNALNKISGLGPQKFKLLLDFFDSPEDIWNAGIGGLRASGIGPAIAEK